jgi:ribosome-associated protein
MANNHIITSAELLPELEFSTSRSSGPGGQNVNKVSTKVIIRWNLLNSTLITDEQKMLLLNKLSSQLTREGELIINSQESRSQLQNKELALEKLDALLRKALTKPKARKATRPTKSSKVKRVDNKKRHAEKKQWRKKLD